MDRRKLRQVLQLVVSGHGGPWRTLGSVVVQHMPPVMAQSVRRPRVQVNLHPIFQTGRAPAKGVK